MLLDIENEACFSTENKVSKDKPTTLFWEERVCKWQADFHIQHSERLGTK